MQRTLFGETQRKCSVTMEKGTLVVQTPYDVGAVAMIKALPYSDRRWDNTRKVWMVDPKHSETVRGILAVCFNEEIHLAPAQVKAIQEDRIIQLYYLGRTKDRDGESLAYGLDERGEWSYVFPESILRQWFEGTIETQVQGTTLYSILGILQSASEDEIKRGYRKMAMQWHPDRCKEQDAQERFIRIKEAYEVLSIQNKRARYDVGLALERSFRHDQSQRGQLQAQLQPLLENGYRSPLRCGLLYVEGMEKVGRFVVSKIKLWEDLTNDHGQILVASWVMGADKPTLVWA